MVGWVSKRLDIDINYSSLLISCQQSMIVSQLFVPKPNLTLSTAMSHQKTVCNGFWKVLINDAVLPIEASDQTKPLCVVLEGNYKECILSYNLEDLLV